jgi:non-specific serine/threonine protein kinase
LKLELARALTMMGIVTSHQGEHESAARLFAEAKGLAEAEGNRERLVSSLNNMAVNESALGNLDVALAHVVRASAIADELGDRFLKANVLDTVGRINLRLGNHEIARRSYTESLTISIDFKDTMNIADGLEGLALMSGGDAARAVVLVSAAEAIRASSGAEPTQEWSVEVMEGIAGAEAKLGRAGTEAARRQGMAMTMEEAVRYALGGSPVDRRGTTSLTAREIQVANLIAEGLTNGEVAQRLRIAARTVDAHIEHIRNKLGLRSRSQIAVWAHERLGRA